jgi:c(7)-type cytochrome triheme protein
VAAQCLLGLLAAVASIAACTSESRHRVLVVLFERGPADDAQAVPVIRSPRHPRPTPTPTAIPQEVANVGTNTIGAALKTWEDVVRLLPKDQMGNPDWGRALQEKVIDPRPGVAPDAAASDVLALDVEIASKSDPAFGVTFSHEKHGQWLACRNCHTDRFAMTAGATPMSAEEVHSGRYCAACHGKVAFDVTTGCPLCHLRMLPTDRNNRVDWSRALAEKRIAPRAGRTTAAAHQPTLDLDVVLRSTTQPTITSVFSHASHTQSLACVNCHPRLFPMEVRPAEARTADLHSRRYCGACHGPVAFGISQACERCHPMLGETKQHQQVFDLDVAVPPKARSSSKTVFSHSTHRFVECASCHTDRFAPTAAPAQMTVADLASGTYCATCHGKVAANLIAPCQRCHPAIENPQPAAID